MFDVDIAAFVVRRRMPDLLSDIIDEPDVVEFRVEELRIQIPVRPMAGGDGI